MFRKTTYASWPHAQHGVIHTREAKRKTEALILTTLAFLRKDSDSLCHYTLLSDTHICHAPDSGDSVVRNPPANVV